MAHRDKRCRGVTEGVYVKSTRRGREILIAACDEELLGRTLMGGRVPFKVDEGFYRGDLVELGEALELIKIGTIVNLVGKRIIEAAIGAKLVHPEAVLYFGETPHAQIIHL
ncbi:MAG: DUF424 domain-containing protein [Candidatus Bathyarchaeia archaeon]